MLRKTLAMGFVLALTLVLGCGQNSPPTAKATLVNTEGQKVGEVTLTETPEGVKIVGTIENLPPGNHAFHIHEKGACSHSNFMSAAVTLIPS